MALNGYARVPRSLLEGEWADDPVTFSVLLHLVLKARHVETIWHDVHLRPGDVVIGRKAFANECGISERQMRTALTRLKSTSYLTSKATNKFTVISLTDKAFLRDEDAQSDQQNDQQNDQPATNKRPTNDHNGKRINDNTLEDTRTPSSRRFTPPTVEEVEDFAKEHKLSLDAERFCDFYASKGWKVGNSAMKDWKASARNWARGRDNFGNGVKHDERPFGGYGELR